jgi:hypothetical protein
VTQRVTGSRLIGVAVGFLGVALLVGVQSGGNLVATVAVIGAALCYAVSVLYAGWAVRELPGCGWPRRSSQGVAAPSPDASSRPPGATPACLARICVVQARCLVALVCRHRSIARNEIPNPGRRVALVRHPRAVLRGRLAQTGTARMSGGIGPTREILNPQPSGQDRSFADHDRSRSDAVRGPAILIAARLVVARRREIAGTQIPIRLRPAVRSLSTHVRYRQPRYVPGTSTPIVRLFRGDSGRRERAADRQHHPGGLCARGGDEVGSFPRGNRRAAGEAPGLGRRLVCRSGVPRERGMRFGPGNAERLRLSSR